jgi:putative transposase
MSRPKRINLPGCVYHIMCRGNRSETVFADDKDKDKFLEYLIQYIEPFEMRIHAYCLMDTHLHLMIESRKPNLSEFMRRLLTAYTVWFNRRHRTCGHLFAGRFKSLVVERGEYLVSVSRYIHRNPVEAGMVDEAEDYPWSSMRIYAGKVQPGFVYTREILHWFGNKRRKYIKFVRDGLDSEIKSLILSQRFMGSEEFAKRMNIRLERENQPKAMTAQERRAWREEKVWEEGRRKADQKMKDICFRMGISTKHFMRERLRKTIYREAMIQFILDMRKETEWTFRHIGRYLNLSMRHVQKLYHEEIKKQVRWKGEI